MRGDRVSQFSLLCALVVALGLTMLLGDPPPAQATCTTQDGHKAGHDQDILHTFQGMHAKIYMQHFDYDQCDSTRSINVWRNGDSAEIGWSAVNGRQPVVFTNYVLDGHSHGPYLKSYSVSAGETHDFKIVNGNQNNYWALDFDGAYVGSFYQNYSHALEVVPQAEREASQDSLWAHFHGLTDCNDSGCTLKPFFSLEYAGDFSVNSSDYHYCPIDNTEFYVKQSCQP
jgi:hypothetical protein